MYKDLDPLLHSQLRLAIMSLLITHHEADFNLIKEKTKATSGNISVQISKLQEAGYIEVIKSFKNNYQNTTLKITSTGIKAFEDYVEALKQYINGK
jgi:DNA-binding MarR family transcriptional regulator